MTIVNRIDIARLPSDELTSRLYSLRVAERQLLVEFLAYLGELDMRKVFLELGFKSTFAFCTDHLGLTRSSAYRRMTAARLMVRFPVVAEYLADGRLGLTTLVEIREVLCEENLASLLGRAAGRTEDEVRVLVAALNPRPAPADLLRRLPERPRVISSSAAPELLPVTASSAAPELPASTASSAAPELLASTASSTAPELPASTPVGAAGCGPALLFPADAPRGAELDGGRARSACIEPISEELRVLRVTVGREFVQDLEAVRDALSHQIPDRGLEAVLHECIRRTLREVARRRTGGDTARTKVAAETPKPKGRRRGIPAAVRKAVWRRDQGSCAFVSADGRRCGSTYQLELHHIQAFAKGGPATAVNISLRCSRHNRFHADEDFGAEKMARVTRGQAPFQRAPPGQ